jgi:membrane protein
MAQLKDLLPAVRATGFIKLILMLIRSIARHQLTTQAAAVAYAWLFAMFPFVLFLITLFAYIPEKQKVDANRYIEDAVHRLLARDAAATVIDNLKQVLNEPRSGLLSVGIAATLWIASGGMSMTMTALDAAYDSKKTWPFYLQRLVAILLTTVVTVMILIVLILLPVGTQIESWLADNWHLPATSIFAITIGRYFIAFLLLHCILVMLYTFGTRGRKRFVFFSPGAMFTLLVWFGLQWTFRFYIDRFGKYQKTYGAIGGVAILLLFFYLDALVMLIGAEINSQIDRAVRGGAKPSESGAMRMLG